MKRNLLLFTSQKLAAFCLLLMLSLSIHAQTNVYTDIIATSPNHTYLATALQQEGLDVVLQDPNADYTVFAPTNDAFDDLAAALGTNIAGLLALPNLSDILQYHVLNVTVPSSAVTNGAIVNALSSTNTLKLTKTSTGDVFVNQAQVTTPDLTSDNGTVHVLDAIVLPVETVADIAIDNGFTYLVTAVVQEELLPALTDPLGTYTVFAPTNDAFDDLAAALGTNIAGLLALPNLQDVLLYHVLGTEVASSAVTNGAIVNALSSTNTLKLTKTSTGDVFVNQAQVTTPDLTSDNGTVHVLDAIVLPVETVADIAIDNGFTYLVTAVVQEELLPALTDPLGTYTVFAPTNDAFDDLAAALGTNIAGLLALPNLQDVLLYHVLDTEVASSAVTNGAIVNALSSTNTLKLTKTSTGDVFVNQAQVTTPDLTSDNGTVHVLDAIVLPVETVADIAIDNGFTYLVTAVVQEELLPALTDPLGTYTVFAPTNDAFDDLAAALGTNIAGLLALPNLQDVLLYHVLDTEVASSAVTNGAIVNALSSTNTLKLTKTSTGDVFVNQAQVTTPDLTSDNGTVHVLDAIVLPVETVADIAIDNGFTYLVTAVVQEELLPALTDPLGTYTVFAPTNDAFDDLAAALGTNIAGLLALPNLQDVLLYHVLDTEVASSAVTNGAIVNALSSTNTLKLTKTSTGDVFVNQAQVTTPDLTSDNGTVHVLDAIVLPVETVADIAIDNGFTYLVTAVVQEELLPALTDPLGTYTVFAPTNDAFDDLAAALGTNIAGLLALPNLQDVLLYHVLGAEVLSTGLTNGQVATLNGDSLTVDLTMGVKINNATVTTPDILADNGVVHVIDAVLVPTLVGIDNPYNHSLTISPNPTTDYLNVRDFIEGNFEIYDIYGKKVMEGAIENQSISVSALANGSYIVRVANSTQAAQSRFVKQ